MRFPSSGTVREFERALREASLQVALGRTPETCSPEACASRSEAPLQARLCGGESVVEKHGACHRADPSGDGGDPGRLRLDLIEAHVPDESPFFFAVDADIDDDCPIPDVLGPDHLPAARRDDEDVSPPGDFWKVTRSRVADGDGRVLAQQ